jgi:hypothetical protein
MDMMGIEPAASRLIAQFINKLRYRTPPKLLIRRGQILYNFLLGLVITAQTHNIQTMSFLQNTEQNR